MAGVAFFDSMSRAQADLTEFVAERLRHDMDAQNKFMTCRNLDDFRAAQKAFFDDAMHDYAEISSRILKMADAFVPVVRETEETFRTAREGGRELALNGTR